MLSTLHLSSIACSLLSYLGQVERSGEVWCLLVGVASAGRGCDGGKFLPGNIFHHAFWLWVGGIRGSGNQLLKPRPSLLQPLDARREKAVV